MPEWAAMSGVCQGSPAAPPAPIHWHGSTWHNSFISVYPRDREMWQCFQGEARPCGGREGSLSWPQWSSVLSRAGISGPGASSQRDWYLGWPPQARCQLGRGVFHEAEGAAVHPFSTSGHFFPIPAELAGRNSPFQRGGFTWCSAGGAQALQWGPCTLQLEPLLCLDTADGWEDQGRLLGK